MALSGVDFGLEPRTLAQKFAAKNPMEKRYEK
jgi:hypothetical protein